MTNQESSSPSSGITMKTFVIYVGAFLLIWSLRAILFIHIDEGINSPFERNVYSSTVKFILWAVPVFVVLRASHQQPLAYLKLTTPVNSRGLLVGALVTLAWFSLVILGEALISGRNAGAMLSTRSSEWLTILASGFVSPLSEEILCRGFFLNRLSESLSFWTANVISALLFMLAHWPYWISKSGFSPLVIKDSVNVVLLGCLFGWLMMKTNSLWPAIGAHIANNFLASLIRA